MSAVAPGQQRTRASAEAVERRRMNRRARREAKHRKREDRMVKERVVAERMFRRFYHDRQPPHMIVLDYRYWQARRCGWDALSDELSIDRKGHPVDPHDGATWVWWTLLHWQQREWLASHSINRLLRP